MRTDVWPQVALMDEPSGVIDPSLDHYQVNHVGWDKGRRVHGVVLHFDIIDDKFWVKHDGTD